MLQSHHYELLEKLRFGKTAQERKEVLHQLITFEDQGKFENTDYLRLLQDPDSVFQLYAIGALGRQKVDLGKDRLKAIYLDTANPLMLTEILTAFMAYGTGDFVDVVLKKLKKSGKKKGPQPKAGARLDRIFDGAFILDQILIPSLKYLQNAGNSGIEKSIRFLLDHEDEAVRWHTLLVYDKRGLPLKTKRLVQIKTDDQSALVRELAAIMLEKRQKKTTHQAGPP